MPLNVLQRLTWGGEPNEFGDLFRLKKNGCVARAALQTHQLGWEIRLLVGKQSEAVRTQVCRSQDEVLSTGETWKAAMIEKGQYRTSMIAPCVRKSNRSATETLAESRNRYVLSGARTLKASAGG